MFWGAYVFATIHPESARNQALRLIEFFAITTIRPDLPGHSPQIFPI